MTNKMKTQICHDDFYLMMRNAVIESGGLDDVESWKKMKLEDLVNLLAHNGLRMVYLPERHMDAVKIDWESPDKKSPTPKKKLLCDTCDRDEIGG